MDLSFAIAQNGLTLGNIRQAVIANNLSNLTTDGFRAQLLDPGTVTGPGTQVLGIRDSGDFEASTNTRSEATGEVLRLMVDEFWRLQRERVGQRELADAKAYMTGSFPLTIETPDLIATQVLNQLFYELPLNELQTFPERVKSVTPDDVQRVARTYLRPDRLAIVLVGNANAFAKDLGSVGFAEFERIPIDQVDLLAADLRKSGRVGNVEESAATTRRGSAPAH